MLTDSVSAGYLYQSRTVSSSTYPHRPSFYLKLQPNLLMNSSRASDTTPFQEALRARLPKPKRSSLMSRERTMALAKEQPVSSWHSQGHEINAPDSNDSDSADSRDPDSAHSHSRNLDSVDSRDYDTIHEDRNTMLRQMHLWQPPVQWASCILNGDLVGLQELGEKLTSRFYDGVFADGLKVGYVLNLLHFLYLCECSWLFEIGQDSKT